MVRSKNVLGTILQSFIMIAAIFIGLLAGAGCYYAVTLKSRFGYTDSLDVIGIHGVGGLIGTIFLGLFASKLVNPGGADGLFAGNPGFLGTQLFGIGVVGVYTYVISGILLKLIDSLRGLRQTIDEEVVGLDQIEHSETAYNN
ncbi:hypothetical protein ACFL6N_00910 [Thermodesulfobacteriota bacterium]